MTNETTKTTEDNIAVKKITQEHRLTRAPAGRKFIAVSLGYWGQGHTIGEALDQLHKHGGGRATDPILVCDYDESTQVMSDGSTVYNRGSAPRRLVLRRERTPYSPR